MIELSVAKRVPAEADKVFAFISGQGIRDLVVGKYVESVVPVGEGPGCILTTTLNGGIRIIERIDSIDVAEREFNFSVIDSGPMTYGYYRGTMRVQPAGPGSSIMSCHVKFICESGTEEKTSEGWVASNLNKCGLVATYFEENK